MRNLTAVEMMEIIENNMDLVREQKYGLTVRDLTDAFRISTAQASQALIWLENAGKLTSRKMRFGKVYDAV